MCKTLEFEIFENNNVGMDESTQQILCLQQAIIKKISIGNCISTNVYVEKVYFNVCFKNISTQYHK